MLNALKIKLDMRSVTENCFFASVGAYILYLILNTTMFKFEYPVPMGELLLCAATLTAIAKCAVLLRDADDKRQWLRLCVPAMAVAVVYALVWLSDRYGFLIFFAVLTVGMVGTDYRKAARLYACVTAIGVGTTVIAALSGIIPNLVYLREGTLRSSWGIGFPTDYASYLVFTCIVAWVGWQKVPNWLFVVLGGVSLLNAQFIANSRTSAICSALFMVAVFGYGLMSRLAQRFRDKTPDGVLSQSMRKAINVISWIVSLAFPLCALFVFFMMYCHAKEMGFALAFDSFFSGRLSLALDALEAHGLSLFGTPFEQIGAGGTTFARAGYNIVDSSYVLILLRYGTVLFLILAALWPLMSRKAIKRGDWRLALALAVIAFHSISEHHFPEINYNIFLILPFAILGMDLIKNQPQECAEGNCPPSCATAPVLLTTVFITALALFTGPLVLSYARTAWDMLDAAQVPGRLQLAFVSIALCIACYILFIRACYRLIYTLVMQKVAAREGRNPGTVPGLRHIWRSCCSRLCPPLFPILCAIIACNLVIAHYQPAYIDVVAADAKAIEAVQQANSETGGKLYADEVPTLYQRTYGGFSSSFFTGEDLARCKDATVIVDADLDSVCFILKGFLYAQISDDHALYTNDEAAIAALEKVGCHVTGYYAKQRTVDLRALAELNDLKTNADGALILQGPDHALSTMSGLELRGSIYTVTYDLLLSDTADAPRTEDDYELGNLSICVEDVQDKNKDAVLATVPLMRSQFDDGGAYTAEIPLYIPESQSVKFLASANDGQELLLRGISYQRTPDRDTHITYDDGGRNVKEMYFDLEGAPLQMPEGHFGCTFEYDADGNASRVTYLDADGNPTVLNAGYTSVSRKFDANKHVTREEYYDDDQALVINGADNAGYAIAEHDYDAAGNEVATRLYDEQEHPVVGKAGYSSIQREFDGENRVTHEAYFDADGKPIAIGSGQYGLALAYDDAGNVATRTFLDAEGNPQCVAEGYAQIVYEYDEAAHVTREQYLDQDSKPVVATSGFAEVRREYDDAGHITQERYFDERGNPVLIPSGYASVARAYDEDGNEVRVSLYDEQGALVVGTSGYAELRHEFDADGHVTRESYYGADGVPMAFKGWYAAVVYEYDEAGNVTSRQYVDTDGNPTLADAGFAQVAYEYDEAAHVTHEQYFGAQGEPVLSTSSCAEIRREYDEDGHVTSERYFGTNGEPIALRAGHAGITYEYDESGNITERVYRDSNGDPIAIDSGFAQVTYEYDEAAHVTREQYFDADGEPVCATSGCAEIQREYDEDGRLAHESYYDTDGKPAALKAGHVAISNEYDEAGNLAKRSYLDADGQPILLDDGYAQVSYEYDEDKHAIREQYFDERADLVTETSGYAEVRREFDTNGRVTREAYFDAEGQPAVLEQGHSAAVYAYDEAGRRTDTYYYNGSDQLTPIEDGYAHVHVTYNDKGQNVQEAYYGADDEPILLEEGYAQLYRSYDALGNVVSEVYADAYGEPTVYTDGFTEIRKTYDLQRRLVRDEYYDLAGNPCAHEGGYYATAYLYDSFNRESERRYLDAQGNLVNTTDGYATEMNEYDLYGTLTRTLCYATNGTLVDTIYPED